MALPPAPPQASKKSDHVIADITEKIAFASYLPLLTRATADNKDSTPGYMLTEIEKLSYDYPHHCPQLAAYLSRRLEKPSAQVKLKVLKVMDHLVREGHVNVRQALRRHDGSIKMATLYHGIPDPLTGTTLYEKIRTQSKSLLELLFLPEKIEDDEKHKNDPVSRSKRLYLGALGSSSSNESKYEGFGNSPIVKEETVADKVMSYFDRFSTNNDQNNKIIREGIASSVGSYEAVHLPHLQLHVPVSRPMPSMLPLPRPSRIKAHVPGKAGGGWDDDEDAEELRSPHTSVVSADSLDNVDNDADNSAERDLIAKFCSDEKFPVPWKELSDTCNRCVQLSVSECLSAIAGMLSAQQEGTSRVMRALTLLDCLLHSEFVASGDVLQVLSTHLSRLSSDAKAPAQHRNKADKILLVLTKREMLPT